MLYLFSATCFLCRFIFSRHCVFSQLLLSPLSLLFILLSNYRQIPQSSEKNILSPINQAHRHGHTDRQTNRQTHTHTHTHTQTHTHKHTHTQECHSHACARTHTHTNTHTLKSYKSYHSKKILQLKKKTTSP